MFRLINGAEDFQVHGCFRLLRKPCLARHIKLPVDQLLYPTSFHRVPVRLSADFLTPCEKIFFHPFVDDVTHLNRQLCSHRYTFGLRYGTTVKQVNHEICQRPRAYGCLVVGQRERSATELPGAVWPYGATHIFALQRLCVEQDSYCTRALAMSRTVSQPCLEQILGDWDLPSKFACRLQWL